MFRVKCKIQKNYLIILLKELNKIIFLSKHQKQIIKQLSKKN